MNSIVDMIVSTPSIIVLGLGLSFFFSMIVGHLSTEPERRREEAKKRLHQNLLEKLKANVTLNVTDILNIGRGLGVSRAEAVEVIYMLMAEAKENNDIEVARHLLDDIDKKAPYEDLPDDVKPAVIRLSEICAEATLESDKSLLIPIQRALAQYKVMLGEHQNIKTQSRVSYVVSIVSFIVGIVGLTLAFRSPSASDVRQTITSTIQDVQTQNFNKGLQPAAGPPNPRLKPDKR